MKRLSLIVFALISFSGWANAQTDSTGNAGDNLDLFAVMDLFKKSQNLEEFEKALNTENNGVNNLDLNKDGKVDYIHVMEYADSSAHAIVLQVAVNETEKQDVATIELDQVGDQEVNAQIVGNDDLYDNYIVEPTDDKSDVKSEKTHVVVNVWTWPCVRYIYTPGYVVWHSPWYWRHYPGWWSPWHPVYWHVYHRRHVHCHGYYYRPYHHRTVVAHRVYHRHRVYSPTVRKTHPVSRQKTYQPARNPKPVKQPQKTKEVRKMQNKRTNPAPRKQAPSGKTRSKGR